MCIRDSYNSEVTRPVFRTVTNVVGGIVQVTSNVVSGVWIDSQKQLRAKNVKGVFVLEYYETGTYDEQVHPEGIEIVEVRAPEIQLIYADVGSRLTPLDSYWNARGKELDADVTVGMGTTAYKFDQAGPKKGWVWCIKRTVDAPWSLEIYWRHRGVMGVLWPFECDWYACDWPRHPQLRVVADSTKNTAPVLVPQELTAEVMDGMDPPLHAKVVASGRSLMMTAPGYCVVKYTTHDDIWFEVIRSVFRTDASFFDLEPRDWFIGEELRPPPMEAHAMAFDGIDDYVTTARSWLNRKSEWTLTLWFNPGRSPGGVLYSEGHSDGEAFRVGINKSDLSLRVGLWNATRPGNWCWLISSPNAVRPNLWQYLTVTFSGGSDTTGVVRVLLNGQSWAATNAWRVSFREPSWGSIAASKTSRGFADFFGGRIDQVRIWNVTLSDSQAYGNRYRAVEETLPRPIAAYEFDEGQGRVVHNEVGGYHGTTYGQPLWCYGQIEPGGDYASFPGYIYQPVGTRYNVNRYNYPTETRPQTESYIFAVNTGMLEVWWANRTRQEGMPAVYYPSLVSRYRCEWPTNSPQIIIASGLGSNGDQIRNTDAALSFNGINS
ncbi:MAG: LamG domain-containing protein, partial [Verrucomicrobiae bacterium]|nr:LamG domain-containing protein [Verrucomicrobiae bacterium]